MLMSAIIVCCRFGTQARASCHRAVVLAGTIYIFSSHPEVLRKHSSRGSDPDIHDLCMVWSCADILGLGALSPPQAVAAEYKWSLLSSPPADSKPLATFRPQHTPALSQAAKQVSSPHEPRRNWGEGGREAGSNTARPDMQ